MLYYVISSKVEQSSILSKIIVKIIQPWELHIYDKSERKLKIVNLSLEKIVKFRQLPIASFLIFNTPPR